MPANQSSQQQGEQPSGSSRVRVFIEDHTGNKRREARLAANTDIEQLIPAIVTALKLPISDPNGTPITYHLAFDNRQLQRNETLSSVGVAEGAMVTLVPEMTAGGGLYNESAL